MGEFSERQTGRGVGWRFDVSKFETREVGNNICPLVRGSFGPLNGFYGGVGVDEDLVGLQVNVRRIEGKELAKLELKRLGFVGSSGWKDMDIMNNVWYFRFSPWTGSETRELRLLLMED